MEAIVRKVSQGDGIDKLIQFWRDFDPGQTGPQIHHEDKAFFAQHDFFEGRRDLQQRVTFEPYTGDNGLFQPESPDFHFSLTPVPYVGNLRKAEVVILMLNWGLDYTCYHAEAQSEFREEVLLPNLRQEDLDLSFPFFCLNPRYCWYGGFEYWEKRFRRMILELVKDNKVGNYLDGLQEISRRIAVLQIIPYTSRTFGGRHEKLITESRKKESKLGILPSAQLAREAAQSLKDDPGKSLIVVRRAKWWGVGREKGRIISYEGSEGRGGYFTQKAKNILLKPWE